MFAYNNNSEFLKFQNNWKAEESLMRENGASEDVIAELYNFSLATFNSNRRFYEKLDLTTDTNALKKTPEPPNNDFDYCFDLLNQIENPKLLKGLKSLSPTDLKIYVLHHINGFNRTEIADLIGKSRQHVGQRLTKITAILRNYF